MFAANDVICKVQHVAAMHPQAGVQHLATPNMSINESTQIREHAFRVFAGMQPALDFTLTGAPPQPSRHSICVVSLAIHTIR